MSVDIRVGDCLDVLRTLDAASVQTCVTSPPYFGLRDYGHTGQIGLEATPDAYVAKMVGVFAEVRRVLADDGTLWLNLGDSYNAYNGGAGPGSKLSKTQTEQRPRLETGYGLQVKSLKPKDLMMIPHRVALALQADGWFVRADIIWHKPNPMPESVTDRPTKAHEYLFLLSKSERYLYDADAIAEPCEKGAAGSTFDSGKTATHQLGRASAAVRVESDTRNRRSVWTVATTPYSGAHFATFPPALIEPCILAGTSPQACEHCGVAWGRVTERCESEPDATQRSTAHYNTAERYGANNGGNGGFDTLAARMRVGQNGTRTTGWQQRCDCQNSTGSARCTILDPFFGAGTTGLVADRLGRDCIGIELNPQYAELARRRVTDDCPLFADVAQGAYDKTGTDL